MSFKFMFFIIGFFYIWVASGCIALSAYTGWVPMIPQNYGIAYILAVNMIFMWIMFVIIMKNREKENW